ncbi:MAG: hypothetical protein ACRDJW_02755 [Thermomicrobiales bacterium]
MVPRTHAGVLRWRPGRLMVGLVALTLLTMPTDYRGGADVSHAHAFFQFWTASGLSAHDHHNHAHHFAPSRVRDHALAGERWLLAPVTPRVEFDGHSREIDPPPDVPILTELSVSAEHGGLLSLALAITALIVFGRPSLHPSAAHALSPAFVRPWTPPPK